MSRLVLFFYLTSAPRKQNYQVTGLLLAFGEQRKQICVKLICGVGRRRKLLLVRRRCHANYATNQLDAKPGGAERWEEEE